MNPAIEVAKRLLKGNGSCRMRSFLSTAVKQGLATHTALEQLFAGEVPAFMRQDDRDQAA